MLATGTPVAHSRVMLTLSTICGDRECHSTHEVEKTRLGPLCSHCRALFAPILVRGDDDEDH